MMEATEEMYKTTEGASTVLEEVRKFMERFNETGLQERLNLCLKGQKRWVGKRDAT